MSHPSSAGLQNRTRNSLQLEENCNLVEDSIDVNSNTSTIDPISVRSQNVQQSRQNMQNINVIKAGQQQFFVSTSTTPISLGVGHQITIQNPTVTLNRLFPVNSSRRSSLPENGIAVAGQSPIVRAAGHPTLVSSLASPVKQISSANSTMTVTPSAASTNPLVNHVGGSVVTKQMVRLADLPPPAHALKRKLFDAKAERMCRKKMRYAEAAAELYTLENSGGYPVGSDLLPWRLRRPIPPPLQQYLTTHRMIPEDPDNDLIVLLATLQQQPSVEVTRRTALPVDPLRFISIVAPALPVTTTALRTAKTATDRKTGRWGVSTLSAGASVSVGSFDAVLGSQEQIVERAKQEAYVVQRVSELQREGLWAEKRLPKVQEPPRNKAHWDYLLEEMLWMSNDFEQERKWKKASARKCARMVQKYFQDKEILQKKEEKSQELKLRKIAHFMAKEVKAFWSNVNKLVEYKQTTRLEEKRKQALDQHLSFIVDQTEKYSSWLAESMNKQPTARSETPTTTTTTGGRNASDDDFRPEDGDEGDDDEETIAKEEEATDQDKENNQEDEIERLKAESLMPLEDLLKQLPSDYFNRDSEENQTEEKDFQVNSSEETSDDEATLDEQEAVEGKTDHNAEIAELEADNKLTIEELRAKYASHQPMEVDTKSKDSDDDDTEEDEDDDDDEDEEEDEVDEDEETSAEERRAACDSADEDVSLKTLVENKKLKEEEADKEINHVTALAESIQPKGSTLLTAQVQTPIPFLLKHSLREYQHIGLDWLVTMYGRKLNGILADEMGLGKTIQTIALLAHLACVEGNWGPHLIIVPTSVMLNWEMEFKKWCPAFKILTYFGTIKERKLKRSGWTKPNAFHVCITSYKLVIQDHQSFRRKKWQYLILDEAQNIKNFKSQRWQLLLNFQTERRLLLTGTPLQNNLMELWSLMHFLMPDIFESHREFKEWFSNPVTGMLEGSAEYNENIIKRLHKVLRPFLLRRLKTEVERQLPKKYEHVVMCRLSKRQRYLYDDFMSRAKTKETLASGNLLSVINVLMQLRKVCNHPNLFEVRPVISPFRMEGIVFYTASIVERALEYDPFRHIDLNYLNLRPIIYEEQLTAYASYRMQKAKISSQLIEGLPQSAERMLATIAPQAPRLKVNISLRIIERYGRMEKSKMLKTRQENLDKSQLDGRLMPAKVGTSPSIRLAGGMTICYNGAQVNLVPINKNKPSAQVKAENGEVPVQVVDTANGRLVYFNSNDQNKETIAAQPPNSAVIVKSDTLAVDNISPLSAQTDPPQPQAEKAEGSKLSMLPPPATAVPMTFSVKRNIVRELIYKKLRINRVSTSAPTNQPEPRNFKYPILPPMRGIEQRKRQSRQARLRALAQANETRCAAYPICGSDMVQTFYVANDSPSANKADNLWMYAGATHCRRAAFGLGSGVDSTRALEKFVNTPGSLVNALQDVLSRFVVYVPEVSAPLPTFHVSHPSPSRYWRERRELGELQKDVSQRCDLLHQIASSMATQFPHPRLIQYDCGKLQVLDRLLRQLKANHHKVLLFTQMTRMLDVLEAFLNYHGHIYLRLDGTTRVDQRQVLMERFNNDKRIFVFILSTRSGGVGVNLTGADTVIFYDSDWNPTMDAQAQDRCHRIGQTRDVHIYRLISEMTVEENILKKANQKRMLGDLAIEGGNFTTAYFRSSTIQDLFNVDTTETDAAKRLRQGLGEKGDKDVETTNAEGSTSVNTSADNAMGALQSALTAAEDDMDVAAAQHATAEAAAELAEFDENIPLDGGPGEENDATGEGSSQLSRVEMEINMIVDQLKPVERYAMRFVEENEAAWSAEQLALAEKQIEDQKREWELNRQAALKAEEEERRRREENGSSESDDDDELVYSRQDATSQVRKRRKQPSSSSSSASSSPFLSSSSSDDADDDEKSIDQGISFKRNRSIVCRSGGNSQRKTRSAGSVDINLWTLDDRQKKKGNSKRKKVTRVNGKKSESSDVDVVGSQDSSNDGLPLVHLNRKKIRKRVTNGTTQFAGCK